VKFVDLGKTYVKENGDKKLVFEHLNGLVRRLDKVAVVE